MPWATPSCRAGRGFLLAGLSLAAMAAGGLLAGLAVAVGAGALSRATGGREDASLAALYLVALAAGVAMVSWRGGAVELTTLLFGSVLGVDDAALLLMAGSATVTLAALALAWRPLVLECFDPSFAQAVGARGAWWHMGFLALVVLNLIAAFQALGTLMAVGLIDAAGDRGAALGAAGGRHGLCGGWDRRSEFLCRAAAILSCRRARAGRRWCWRRGWPGWSRCYAARWTGCWGGCCAGRIWRGRLSWACREVFQRDLGRAEVVVVKISRRRQRAARR